uniref:branched-chain amino acid ABC transporter permease n=1 Tax=Enterocloster aldenensis TaxID=358742 RepID=UPI0022E15B0E
MDNRRKNMLFLQQLINGLSVGSVYALMAVGYSLIYSLLNFSNFAHSAAVAMGAYATLWFLSLLMPSLEVAIPVGILMGAVISIIIQLAAYRPLLKKNARRIYLLIAGLGVSTISENLLTIASGGRFEGYPVNLSTVPLKIGSLSIGMLDMATLILACIALILVQLFIKKTRSGLAIRSAAFDLDTASLMGVDVQKLILVVFAIAGILAGLAGTLLGAKYTVYPTIGSLTNKAFIASVLGGLGSVPGAMLGAVTLGVIEAMVAGYISSAMRDLFSYVALVAVLLFLPQGFMGKSSEDKA